MIAFFDFDGTIYRKDSYLEFIRFVNGDVRYYVGLLILSPFILVYFLGLYKNHQLKELFFRFFLKSYSQLELEELGNKFSQTIIPKHVFQDALERISWHKQQGHRVVVLSASSDLWLKSWTDKHQLDLIATQFEKDGLKYSGNIQGKNCFREEKRRIVVEIMNQGHYSNSYGYGDSKADLPFLKEMDYAYYGSLEGDIELNKLDR